jgi:nicotinate-nucleotide--dimethylbenzimidazole phosphoribosyltransferase
VNDDRDVTPERLAQLADGAAPRTEAERDAVALMAEVRGLADPAPDAVRRRVRAIASQEASGMAGWRRWLAGGDGRRRLALAAAPVAAAIVALAIAIPLATRDGGGEATPAAGDAPAAARDGSAAEAGGAAGAAAPAPQAAAQGPAAPVAPEAAASSTATATDALRAAVPQADSSAGADAAELDRAVARARATLERAGATGVETRESAGGTAATVVADVPAGRVDAATEALEAQGARVTAGAEGDAGTAPVRATVTVSAGG